MTHFIAWLEQFATESTPIGDLARDVGQDRHDGCFTGTTAEGLRRHIRNRHHAYDGACETTLDAAATRYSAAVDEALRRVRVSPRADMPEPPVRRDQDPDGALVSPDRMRPGKPVGDDIQARRAATAPTRSDDDRTTR